MSPFPVFPLSFGGNIGLPVKQTPMFRTITQTPASGRGELRIPLYEFPRYDFVLDVSYLTGDAQGTFKGSYFSSGTQWQTLMNFFLAVQGGAGNWLFYHPYDNSVGTYTFTGAATSGSPVIGEQLVQTTTLAQTNLIKILGTTYTISGYAGSTAPNNSNTWVGQTSGCVITPSSAPALASSTTFGTSNGAANQAFSMIKTYTTGGAQDLIQNFVGSLGVYGPSIYDNGSLVTNSGGTNYTIDQYGTITFTGYTPATSHLLSWAGQFYYLCHFIEDKWDSFEENYYQIWQIEGLKFRSVLQ